MMKFFIVVLTALLLAAVGFAIIEGKRLTEANDRLIEAIQLQAEARQPKYYYPEQLAGLPPPVQGYLNKVLVPGMPITRQVRLQQHGIFNIGEETPQWLPLKATSHYATMPPGMLWKAKLSIAPPLSLSVTDYYHAGKGGFSVKALGALPVVDALPALELDQGELMTWLAESVWFPTALLPGNEVSWADIDEQSARATVDDGHQQVSLDFHFNSQNEVVSVSTPSRAREVNGSYQMLPWSTRYRDYSRRNKILIPLEGEAIWQLPTGDYPYVRIHIDKLEYDPQF